MNGKSVRRINADIHGKFSGNNRYELLDIFKVAAAILVVSLHTNFLGQYSNAQVVFQDIFSSGAVPFFFITSGYFIGKKIDKYVTGGGTAKLYSNT